MAGPAIDGLVASQDDNEITATWRDVTDSGFYRIQARQQDEEWPAPEWRGAGGLEFSGVSGQYVEVPNPPVLEPGESLSVWVSPNKIGSTNTATAPGIVAAASTENWDGHFSFRNTESFSSPEGGELEIQITIDGDNGGGGQCDEFVYTPGNPISLCVTVEDDGSLQYYVNGVDRGTASPIDALTLGYLGVGYPGAPEDGTFDGLYDEFRHHNVKLTQEQAQKHYDNEPIYTNGELHYTFDSDTGSTVADQSGSGNDGTLNGDLRVDHEYDDYAILDNSVTEHTLPNKPNGRFYEVRVRTETSNGLGPWTRPVLNYANGDEATREMAGGLPAYYPNSDESSNYDLLEPIGKHLGQTAADIDLVQDASSVEEARSIAQLQELGKLVQEPPLENEPLEHYRARLIAEFAVSSGSGTIRSLIETSAGILDVSPSDISFTEPAGGENGTARIGVPGQALDTLGITESFLIDTLDQLVAAGYRLTAQVIGTFIYINPAMYKSGDHDPTNGYDGLDANGEPKDNGGTYAGLIT